MPTKKILIGLQVIVILSELFTAAVIFIESLNPTPGKNPATAEQLICIFILFHLVAFIFPVVLIKLFNWAES